MKPILTALVLFLAVFLGIGIIGACINAARPPSGPGPATTKPASALVLPGPANIVTFAQYQKITAGMTRAQVEAIIGTPGEEVTSGRMEGVPGVMEPIETVMLQWYNKNMSGMNAMFQNDSLITKAQFGLR